MQYLRRNPFVIWTKWWIHTRRQLRQNEGKNLKIGHLTYLNNVVTGRYVTLYDNVVIHNSTIGNYVYIQDHCVISNATIGNFCSFGPNIRIGPGMHPVGYISTFPAFYSTKLQCQVTFTDKDSFIEKGNVQIGNDVWIGANALIMDNITIHDGAVVAAGAIVTKDVEPYTIVGGVPAGPIKKRFSDEQIEKLLAFRWWDRDEAWLRENHYLFHDPDAFFREIKF